MLKLSEFCAYTGQKLAQLGGKIAQARWPCWPLFASLFKIDHYCKICLLGPFFGPSFNIIGPYLQPKISIILQQGSCLDCLPFMLNQCGLLHNIIGPFLNPRPGKSCTILQHGTSLGLCGNCFGDYCHRL